MAREEEPVPTPNAPSDHRPTTATVRGRRRPLRRPAPRRPRLPQPPAARSKRKTRARRRRRWRCVLAGAAYGVVLPALSQPLREHRQRLRAGQRRPADAAGRRHRRRDQRRRHRLRQGRPVARPARSGRRAGRARPGRGAARADGARSAHAVRQQRLLQGADRRARGRRRARAERRAARPGRRQPARAAGRAPARSARKSSTMSTAQLAAAKSALAAAESATDAAREQLASNQSLTENISVEQHPNVLRAAARVREAYLALSRAELVAPVDGYVARRSVQLGQRVQAGAPLLSVIAAQRRLGRRQLQGRPAAQPAHRPAGRARGRRLRQEGHLPRQDRRPRRRHGRGVRAAAGAERHRQLDQGRAARAGADRARPEGGRRRIRCASACRWTPRSTSARPAARCSPTSSQKPARAQTNVFELGNEKADAEVKRIIAANMGKRVGAIADAQPVAAARRSTTSMPTLAQSSAAAAASTTTAIR